MTHCVNKPCENENKYLNKLDYFVSNRHFQMEKNIFYFFGREKKWIVI
jgi:hypothetical protein